MATLRVGEGDTVTLSGGTQLAVVEDGQCYLIDLSPSSDGVLSMTPTPVIFQKIGSEEDGGDEESRDEAITLQYFASNSNSEGHQIYLDDEQARAVANLLEFHNQQTSPTVSSSSVLGSNGLVTPTPSSSSSDGQRHESPEEILPHSMPVAISEHKKPPLRTYSRRARCVQDNYLDGRQNEVDHNSTQLVPAPDNPKYILPNSSMDLHTTRKKRRLFTDSIKVIPTSEFRQQLQDTSDIVQKKIDCAPPTKKAMYFLTYGGVGKFFAYPGRKIMSVPLSKLFFSRLTMTIEQKSYPVIASKKLEPLDANLRTPATKEIGEFDELQSRPLSTHIFNDAAAKRTASSFDYFCKGMTKPPKFEYKRKTPKASTSTPDVLSLKTSSIKQKVISKVENEETSVLVVKEPLNQKPTSMEIGSHTLVASACDAENTGGDIVYTIQDSSVVIKSETEPHSSDLFVDENQEPAGGPSNFDMLIAAAEQHNSLPSNPDTESSIETEIKEEDEMKEDVEEDANKSGVVYCTNESMEQLIILGANGERYRVTSNQGELTLWPETDCDPID